MSDFAVLNPATGVIRAEYPTSSDAEVTACVDVAANAFAEWRVVPLEHRVELLRKLALLVENRKEVLARAVSREMGKRLVDAMGELDICISIANYYADNG